MQEVNCFKRPGAIVARSVRSPDRFTRGDKMTALNPSAYLNQFYFPFTCRVLSKGNHAMLITSRVIWPELSEQIQLEYYQRNPPQRE